MFRSKLSTFMLAMSSVYTATLLIACDFEEEGDDQQFRDDVAPVGLDRGEHQAQDPEASAELAGSIASQGQATGNHHWWCHPLAGTQEDYYISVTTDTISTTSATGGLFAQFPAGIAALDEAEIQDGFMLTFKVYDGDNNLVGFGTEQEEQDLENASADTALMITLPGRGTLMLKQIEDFRPYFDEIEDMIAEQDYVRTFDPPFVVETTVQHTGWVVGGTGEFTGARGRMVEIDSVDEIDLPNQKVDMMLQLHVEFI